MPHIVAEATTQPVTLPLLWLVPCLLFVICAMALMWAHSDKRRFVDWFKTSAGRRVVNGGVWAATVLTPLFASAIRFAEMFDGKFDGWQWWKVSLLIVSFSAQVFFTGIIYFSERLDSQNEEAIKELAEVLERQEQRRQSIREIVNSKAQRIRDAVRGVEQNVGVLKAGELAEALDPKGQMSLNLICLHKAVRQLIGKKGSLRIAIFLPAPARDGLVLQFSYDGRNSNCITTPQNQHADCFKLNNARRKCLAICAAKEGGLLVVPNTGALRAKDRNRYEHFDEPQRARIKSICAYGYALDDVTPFPVITADSDRKGTFQDTEEFRNLLEMELQEFGSRLLFEADVLKLLASQADGEGHAARDH